MGLIAWVKGLFARKEERVPENMELAAKITILKLGQDLHADTITEIIEKVKQSEEFRAMVANAFTNLDNRVGSVEEMAKFLFERASEQEVRLSNVEESNATTEFHKIVANVSKEEG